MKAAILFAALAMVSACSDAEDPDDSLMQTNQSARTLPANPAALAGAIVPDAARTAVAPAATASPAPTGLGAAMPVRGDFSNRPLPAELDHLNGLGARSLDRRSTEEKAR